MSQLPDEKAEVEQSSSEVAQTKTVKLTASKSKILLLLVLVFLGLILFLLLTPSQIREKITPTADFNVHIDIPAAADAYSKFLKIGVEESDRGSFSKAFEILKIDYSKNPTVEKRNMLLKLAEYGNENFEPADFKFKCLDSECVVEIEKAHFKSLRNQIDSANFLSEEQISDYNSSIDAAEDAFLENREDSQFTALSSIFLSLKEISRADDSEAKNLAQTVLNTMVSINKDKYTNAVANSPIYDL